ncbi:hypothetical protein [Phyllobacterium bourgognense]|uniref:hypothetical protein n=1 Tax=Phyllobacterium bourgognense TaxID=314236 RepID=UPI0011C01ECF|nr:hypothetical protein [Phyllobacterium bourgognense]
MAVDSRTRRAVLIAACLTGPVMFFVWLVASGETSGVLYKIVLDNPFGDLVAWAFPDPSGLGGALLMFFLAMFAFSSFFVVAAALFLWIASNPSAKLHRIEGVTRISLISLLLYPAWYAYRHSGNRLPPLDDLVVAVMWMPFISAAVWVGVNVVGWLIEGFMGRTSPGNQG